MLHLWTYTHTGTHTHTNTRRRACMHTQYCYLSLSFLSVSIIWEFHTNHFDHIPSLPHLSQPLPHIPFSLMRGMITALPSCAELVVNNERRRLRASTGTGNLANANNIYIISDPCMINMHFGCQERDVNFSVLYISVIFCPQYPGESPVPQKDLPCRQEKLVACHPCNGHLSSLSQSTCCHLACYLRGDACSHPRCGTNPLLQSLQE